MCSAHDHRPISRQRVFTADPTDLERTTTRPGSAWPVCLCVVWCGVCVTPATGRHQFVGSSAVAHISLTFEFDARFDVSRVRVLVTCAERWRYAAHIPIFPNSESDAISIP